MTEGKTNAKPAGPAAAAAGAVASMTAQADQMMSTAKANIEQAVSQSRDALSSGMRKMNVAMELGRDQVDALMASSKAASGGMQTMAMDVADYYKLSLDRAGNMAQAMTHAKSVPELMHIQGEFAQSQFAHAVADFSKLSQDLLSAMSAMVEPLQRPVVTSDQVHDMLNDK